MRTIKGNQEPPFTEEDLLWQLCGCDLFLFNTITEQIRIEELLLTVTDEEYRQRLLDAAATLSTDLENHVYESSVSDIRPGKARYEHTPVMPAGILEKVGIELSLVEIA